MKLHPNEYSQELHYYPIVVKLIDRCTGSCNVLNEASNKVCVPNLMVENVIQIKSVITINAGVSVKNIIYVKKIFGTLLHVLAKMVNIYQETKTVTRNFHEKYIISGL